MIDKLFFANKHITEQTYWTEHALTVGSAHFQTNKEKLTRKSFDELIQIVDSSPAYVNESTLLDVDKAKYTHSTYVNKNLSNVDDIGEIDKDKRDKVVDGLNLLSPELYEDFQTKNQAVLFPTETRNQSITITVSAAKAENIIYQTAYNDDTVLAFKDILPSYEFQRSTLMSSFFEINDKYKYYYIEGEFVSATYPNAIGIIQVGSSPIGMVRLSISASLNNVKTVAGDAYFQSHHRCVQNHTTKPSITESSVTVSSVYYPFVVHDHGHPSTREQVISYSEPSEYAYATVPIGNYNKRTEIPHCYVGLGRIGFKIFGVQANEN